MHKNRIKQTFAHRGKTYWSFSTDLLPVFLERFLKGTLLYLVIMTCGTYFTAWYVCDMPVTSRDPIALLRHTWLTTLAKLPTVAIRITLAAPQSADSNKILLKAWSYYVKFHTDNMIVILIALVITICFLGWLMKIAFDGLRSKCPASRYFAYGLLTLLTLTLLLLLYFVAVPFIMDAYDRGWARATLNVFWHICVWTADQLENRKLN